MKVVINKCFGGFSISEEAYKYLGLEWDRHGYAFNEHNMRVHVNLIEVIEALGPKANGRHAELKIVEVPNDVCWRIEEYDGRESIEEIHRSWS